jgi:hypothetical protein
MLVLKQIEVRPSGVHGMGLFATQDIPAGQWLYAFNPDIDRKIEVAEATAEELHFGYVSTTDGKLVICGDDARWWNFGLRPNCGEIDVWVNGERVVASNALILAGNELLIDMVSDLDATRKLML